MNDAWLEELSLDACLEHLRAEVVGRLAFVVSDAPIILPVNFRLVETGGVTWIAIRTRPTNVIDQASSTVAFEIDEVDASHRQGWSVLVRGTLLHVDPDSADFRARFDPQPWIEAERDLWLVIEPFSITGRALRAGEREWAFHTRSYL
jgi:nitroimidazol reductase NimA-like FMN-containing flavoprotein (pyridoxamine 5'-phosphate oxidase superfamily)